MIKNIEKILTSTAITLDLICIVMNLTSFNAYTINNKLLEATKSLESSIEHMEERIDVMEDKLIAIQNNQIV